MVVSPGPLDQLKTSISPGVRGALFYAMWWGVIGICEPFITVHFMRLGFDGHQIGWLAAVFPFFTFLLAPTLSRLADRTNHRILVLTLSLTGLGISLILFPFPQTFFSVLPAYALVMAFRSSVVPLADSLIAKMAERRQLDFGHMRLWGSLVFTVTATGLGVIWERTGFKTMFITAGVCFLLVIGAALLLDETKEKPGTEPERKPVTKTEIDAKPAYFMPEPGILCLLAGTFLLVGALFMAGTFGTVYMTMIGGNEMYVGALFGLSALAEVPGMLFGIRIARKLGDTNTLILAFLISALGFAGFALSRTPPVFLAFSILRGLGFGLFLVTTITVINHRAPQNLYASYQGLLNSLCWGLAPLLGGPISGYLFQSLGASTLFLINAGMAVLACVAVLPTYYLWKKKKEVLELA